MPERIAKKVLVIGWDAADWKLIDPLIEQGAMPNLKGLIERGVRGDISSLDPKLSPLLWTSIATGKTADKHGVLNFVEPDAENGTLRVSSSTTRKTKALWNIATQNGLKSHVVNWYATHPAEPIRGVNITNLFQENPPSSPEASWPMPVECVHPTDLGPDIAPLRVHPHRITPDAISPLLPDLPRIDPSDRRVGLIAKHLARCVSVHNVATGLLEAEPDFDLAMVFYETIDVLGHYFMQHHPPRMGHVSERDFALYRHVMNGTYQFHDLMLGRLIELAGPETTIVLLSDHGFHSDHLRPTAQASMDDEHAAMDATWHRPLGMVVCSGPGIRVGQTVYGANLLDIAPTVLTLLGLAPGGDMDGRVLAEAFDRPVSSDRVFGWDALEGESGMHPADKRQDPVAAAESIRQLVDLGYLADLPRNAQAQIELVKRETEFNLGVVYMTTRRAGQAQPIFERLHAAHPDDPRYASNFAHCLYAMGRAEEACAVLTKLVEKHPDAPDAKMLLASAMLAAGRAQEAGELLERTEREMPDRRDGAIMLAEVYLHQRRWSDAKRIAERLVAADPDDPRALNALGAAETYLGHLDRAVELCLSAIERRHFYPEAHYMLGVALTWKKDFPHAIQSLRAAVSMQPGYLNAYRYLASIYRHLGDRTSARACREQAERLIAALKAGSGHAPEMLTDPPMSPEEAAGGLD
jgi:tetratricopeptide (TPR) repeat protein